MQRLRGKGAGGGSAIGSAVILRPPVGIPMLPARLIAEMSRRTRDSVLDPIDIILVAERYSLAIGVAVPWGRVVAVVCEQEEQVESGPIPIVTGVAGLLRAVADDALLLVDGDRGTVLVDPDSAALAAFQAERERISPRRRLYLDFEHQPARTIDGRVIPVAASAANPAETAAASQEGADLLFVPESSGVLLSDQSDGEQVDILTQLGRAAAGKHVMIASDFENVSPTSLLRAALRAEYVLALPLAAGAAGFVNARELLEEARVDLTDQEEDFGEVRLVGRIKLGEELPDELGAFLIGRLILTGANPSSNQQVAEWIRRMADHASPLLIPVIAECPGPVADSIPAILGLGAVGVIVRPSEVTAAKETIRGLDYAACQEEAKG